MKLVKRNTYIDTLERWQDKAVIKVITGVRRCGKSTLMHVDVKLKMYKFDEIKMLNFV